MYGYGPHVAVWGWALGLGSIVFWALLAAAIIGVIVYVTRSGRQPAPPYQGYASPAGPYAPPGPPSRTGPTGPEQVLAVRFARGEIDEAEFRQRMATLRAEAHPTGTGVPPS